MTKLLLLDHHGASVSTLIHQLEDAGAEISIIEPAGIGSSSTMAIDGVVASGGHLDFSDYRVVLPSYSRFIRGLEVPYLGVCLGLRILGHCYGARMRKFPAVTGLRDLHFLREFPLASGVRDCTVYQSHKYGLIDPLPPQLEGYATDEGAVQAVRVAGFHRYGVQFHPELSPEPALGILKNFVALCSEGS